MDPVLRSDRQTCRGGRATERDADFRVSETSRRFNQKDVIFSRSWWDSSVRSPKTERFYEPYSRPLKEWRHVADLFAERPEAENRRQGFLDYLTAQQGSGPSHGDLSEGPDADTGQASGGRGEPGAQVVELA